MDPSTLNASTSSGNLNLDLLECSVCLETLGPAHKVLPCQHTFCTKCLADVWTAKAKDERLCPECRTVCLVDLDRLPSNVILNRILEGIKSSPSKAAAAKKASPAAAAALAHSSVGNIPGNPATNPFLDMMLPTPPTTLPGLTTAKQIPSSTGVSPQSPAPVLPPKPDSTAFFSSSSSSSSSQVKPPPRPPSKSQIFRALYDYEPRKEDELRLKKGELYVVTEKCRDGWFKGTAHGDTGRTGVFPGNYVAPKEELLQPVKVSPSSGSKSATSGSKASNPGDLIKFEEDFAELLLATDRDAQATNSSSAPKRMLAARRAAPAASNPIPPPPPAPASKPREKHRCIMAYPASSEFELDLKEGDVVMVQKKREDGWWKGLQERTGKSGLVPAIFLQKID